MSLPEFTQDAGPYGVGFDLMALVRIAGNALVLQADVYTITYKVWDRAAPNTTLFSGSLDVADVIFDTLQTDNGWDTNKDPDGYNFRWSVPGSHVPEPNREYAFEITGELDDGESWRHKHIHRTWRRT